MKNKRKAIKLLNGFTKRFFPDVVVEASERMESDIVGKRIFVDLESIAFEDPEVDGLFERLLHEQGFNKIKVSMGLFGFIHEIGHLLSAEKYEKNELLRELAVYEYLVKDIYSKDLSRYEANTLYMNLKLEREANIYGYKLYKLFEKDFIKLESQLIKILN